VQILLYGSILLTLEVSIIVNENLFFFLDIFGYR